MDDFEALDWQAWSTRFLLFTGKGGVGKTTVASATAVALADSGRRVLLVSTDPASNLSDVFEMVTTEAPSPVRGVSRLEVMDLDPNAAADTYRSRVIDPYRGVLPDVEISELEERLAGACTVEVAAFDAFARILAHPREVGDYDHVVFDTAPTGHTLRLLSLPAAWSDYLGTNPDATSCLGPLAGLQDDRPVYAGAVETLKDPTVTTVVLVVRPDQGALTVAAAASQELRDLGIRNQTLVVNGVLAHPLAGDRVAEALAATQHGAMQALPAGLSGLAGQMVPLVAGEVVGIAALRRLISLPVEPLVADPPTPAQVAAADVATITELIDDIGRSSHGVVLVTGKGGVGKTTVARLIATALARRGHKVHLSTTDPAGQAAPTAADLLTLTTSAIDPEAATVEYVQTRLDAAARRGLDAAHIDLLAEDLRSPCSQEIAVFGAFHRLLSRGRDQFVVIDTAPTGHTLLLLDVTGAYHRQAIQGIDARLHVVTPLMRLQDPAYSKVIVVTLAETTPVAEATDLQDDLRRAGIEPYGWVVNATLADSGTMDPVLRRRAALEQTQLDRIADTAARSWALPWNPDIATLVV